MTANRMAHMPDRKLCWAAVANRRINVVVYVGQLMVLLMSAGVRRRDDEQHALSWDLPFARARAEVAVGVQQ